MQQRAYNSVPPIYSFELIIWRCSKDSKLIPDIRGRSRRAGGREDKACPKAKIYDHILKIKGEKNLFSRSLSWLDWVMGLYIRLTVLSSRVWVELDETEFCFPLKLLIIFIQGWGNTCTPMRIDQTDVFIDRHKRHSFTTDGSNPGTTSFEPWNIRVSRVVIFIIKFWHQPKCTKSCKIYGRKQLASFNVNVSKWSGWKNLVE